jgi:beta-glucanase (GH16 family)
MMKKFKDLRLRFLLAIPFTTLCIACSSSGGDAIAQDDTPPTPENQVLPDVFAPDYWDNAELVWKDDFDGDALSTDNWSFETGANGWGNNEWQDYVANDNVEVSNGTLKITAKKVGSGQKTGDYTSARLNSKNSFMFGRMEIRAKIPDDKGKGIWPALWMLGNDIQTIGWPACGEIDIMEYVSYDPNNVHFSIHSTANNHVIGTQITSGPVELMTIEEEFHKYGILWTNKYLKFYIDDIDNVQLTFFRPVTSTTENWPFSKPFYFLMNIAVGGNWGGLEGVDDSIFPATMEVDYVHVYQVK